MKRIYVVMVQGSPAGAFKTRESAENFIRDFIVRERQSSQWETVPLWLEE